MFPMNSRYHETKKITLTTPDGDTIVYLQRRFVPDPDRLAEVQEHEVVEGDRLDNITAHYLEDPELFWRLADANGAMIPDELTETVGRRLRITLSEGIPGITDA